MANVKVVFKNPHITAQGTSYAAGDEAAIDDKEAKGLASYDIVEVLGAASKAEPKGDGK